METTDVERAAVQDIFTCSNQKRVSILGDIWKKMAKFHMFSLFHYIVEDELRQVVHICDKCLKKIIDDKDFIFIETKTYPELLEKVKEEKIHPDSFWLIAPNEGCIMSVENGGLVSEICESCQNAILRTLYLSDIFVIHF